MVWWPGDMKQKVNKHILLGACSFCWRMAAYIVCRGESCERAHFVPLVNHKIQIQIWRKHLKKLHRNTYILSDRLGTNSINYDQIALPPQCSRSTYLLCMLAYSWLIVASFITSCAYILIVVWDKSYGKNPYWNTAPIDCCIILILPIQIYPYTYTLFISCHLFVVSFTYHPSWLIVVLTYIILVASFITCAYIWLLHIIITCAFIESTFYQIKTIIY